MLKGLMIILDGLGDRPHVTLNGQTPLEAAHTPCMDKLLAAGCCGLVDPLCGGVPVDTHNGSAALMGITRKDLLKLTRGPVEAAGVGVDMQPGDILLRGNFATLEDDGRTILDRRAGRISKGTEELTGVLQDVDCGEGITASVFAATHHRTVVRLRGQDLSPDISSTDPCNSTPGSSVLTSYALIASDKKARRTAQALNNLIQLAHNRLKNHPLNIAASLPANALVTRGAGMASTAESLLNRLKLSTAVISGERTLQGLARFFGFEVIDHPGFTAGADTDLQAKFKAVNDALEKHDLVYLHIKATDIFSHNQDAQGKKRFLEAIDKAMDVIELDNLVIAISGDHSTDSNSGNHCGDPVPSLLSAPVCRIDAIKHFSEIGCYQGALGRIKANNLLFTLLDHMGRLPNYDPFDAAFVDV